MKTVIVSRFGKSDVLEEKEDVLLPSVGFDQVLVKVVATGVNPVEIYVRAAMFSRLPDLKYTSGSDICGTVVATGIA